MVSEPRLARTCRSTASTVLVPNSQASSTRGASVCSTSHSGMTTFSSTWLVPSTPLHADMARKPGLRKADGLNRPSLAVGAATLSSDGSRLTSRALTAKIPAVSTGTARIASRLPVANARPPINAPRV